MNNGNVIPITKPCIGQEELQAVRQVLESGWLVQGERVKEFEQRIAEHEQVRYCCAVTSCTAALQLAMLAEGMRAGMDVLVPSFTFVATANAVISTGAVPVLVDIQEDTYHLDVTAAENQIKNHYTKRGASWFHQETGNQLWGIVPVHQFGLCADMDGISRIAQTYGLKIIEDAACALGAAIRGRHAGSFGNTACVSFHPRKSITTGEGGMILTNDQALYQKVKELRNHGSAVSSDERHQAKGYLLPQYVSAGFNYRMTDIQGAIGCEQTKKLNAILDARREQARIYNGLLADCERIRTPYVPDGYDHTYQSYVCFLRLHGEQDIKEKKRNRIMEELEKDGIMTRQGTHAVHKLAYYKKRFGWQAGDLPVADRCDSQTVSLPVFAGLDRREQERIAGRLVELTEKMDGEVF